MNTTKSNDNHPQYHCCFCRQHLDWVWRGNLATPRGHFQLEGYRWGYCKLLNVYIKGNINACSVATPTFSDTEKH